MKKISLKSVFSYPEKGIYEFSDEDQLSAKAALIQVRFTAILWDYHFSWKSFLDFDLALGESVSHIFRHGTGLSSDNNTVAFTRRCWSCSHTFSSILVCINHCDCLSHWWTLVWVVHWQNRKEENADASQHDLNNFMDNDRTFKQNWCSNLLHTTVGRKSFDWYRDRNDNRTSCDVCFGSLPSEASGATDFVLFAIFHRERSLDDLFPRLFNTSELTIEIVPLSLFMTF